MYKKLKGDGKKEAHELKKMIREAEVKVTRTVMSIINGLKKRGEKFFSDPDFGPNDNDEFGAFAMYQDGKPPGPNYPLPSKTKWCRPKYAKKVSIDSQGESMEDGDEEDDIFGNHVEDSDEEESWCSSAVLFKDGTSSGDVIQGKLGDCWFLGAIATLATSDELLKTVFFQEDKFSEYGIFVCRFMKDFTWHYVIIDDRIPCFNFPKGQPLFARCRDPDELWVPIIEKAYAKLHGSYDSLIGG